MRTVVNISLPKTLSREVEKTVARESFASKSEFFRYLLRLFLEGELIEDLERSRRELSSGKGKLLKSLKSLR